MNGDPESGRIALDEDEITLLDTEIPRRSRAQREKNRHCCACCSPKYVTLLPRPTYTPFTNYLKVRAFLEGLWYRPRISACVANDQVGDLGCQRTLFIRLYQGNTLN